VDLRLYFRVLWRFRLLVAIGLILACGLSFLSYFRVNFSGASPKITYRQAETWRGTVELFVTQKGFPYGYSVLPNSSSTPTNAVQPTPRFGNPGWFANLAVYYAPLAQGDAFQAILSRRTQIRGIVSAQPVVNSQNLPQPYIDLYAYASTESDAVHLANVAGSAFERYIVEEEIANNIPASKRVELQVVTNATAKNATISSPRKKTTPIVVFLTVLLAAVGLAFVLENVRPRVRPLSSDEEEQRVQARRLA
jgi:hypothetical protein